MAGCTKLLTFPLRVHCGSWDVFSLYMDRKTRDSDEHEAGPKYISSSGPKYISSSIDSDFDTC